MTEERQQAASATPTELIEMKFPKTVRLHLRKVVSIIENKKFYMGDIIFYPDYPPQKALCHLNEFASFDSYADARRLSHKHILRPTTIAWDNNPKTQSYVCSTYHEIGDIKSLNDFVKCWKFVHIEELKKLIWELVSAIKFIHEESFSHGNVHMNSICVVITTDGFVTKLHNLIGLNKNPNKDQLHTDWRDLGIVIQNIMKNKINKSYFIEDFVKRLMHKDSKETVFTGHPLYWSTTKIAVFVQKLSTITDVKVVDKLQKLSWPNVPANYFRSPYGTYTITKFSSFLSLLRDQTLHHGPKGMTILNHLPPSLLLSMLEASDDYFVDVSSLA